MTRRSLIRTRVPELITVMLFVAMITIPGAITITRASSARLDTTEKRTLAGRPAFPRNIKQLRAFPLRFDQFVNDRLILRKRMINLNARIRHKLGASASENVVFGTDGWMFLNGKKYGDPIGDSLGRNRYATRDLHVLAERMEQRRQWLARRGIDFIVVIAPNKASIQTDKLPAGMEVVNSDTAYSQFVRALQKWSKVTTVDLRPALRRERDSSLSTYNKTDTHWNQYGAALAQEELLTLVHKKLGGGLPPSFDPGDFTMSDDGVHDFGELLGVELEEEQPALTKEALRTLCKPTYSRPAGRETFTTTCPTGSGSAVIFRDSFFTALQPYTSAYFRTATYQWSGMGYDITDRLVSKHKPDIVILEMVERKLPTVPQEDAGWLQAGQHAGR